MYFTTKIQTHMSLSLKLKIRTPSLLIHTKIINYPSRMTLPYLPNISSVSPRVLRILGCNPNFMTLQGTNTYVIGTGQQRILIDTGNFNKLEYIKNLQKTMATYKFQINHMIITHWHPDHIGGVINVLNMINNKNECTVWKFKSAQDKSNNFPLSFIKNEQIFFVEGATLKIYHTPGHTSDHVVIMLEEENSLFSGDNVLGEGSSVFEDLNDYLKSLQLILDLNPTVIYPGHGSVIKDPITRVNNYIKHRLDKEIEIFNLINKQLNKTMSEDDIVKTIYKEIPTYYNEVLSYIVQKHLIKLSKDGKIVNNNGTWKVINNLDSFYFC